MKSFLLASIVVALVSFSACGGGSIGGTTNPNTFTIGGTVTGLASGGSVVLQNNGGNDLTVTANGSFKFTSPVDSGSAYNVAVKTNPTGQTCTPTSNTGTATANVTSVVVTCGPAPTFTIGGTVTGLTAGGLTLQDNGGDDLDITQNGTFHFATPVSAYNVTVSSQPNGQTCTVANFQGIATADVTNVAVTCGPIVNENISIVVSGLVAGNDGMQIENNGINPLPVNNNGTFTLSVVEGSPYNITVSTQPAGANCIVSGGMGNANSNVTVTIACTQNTVGTVTINVVVSGLTSSMTGLTLENNGNSSNPLPVNGNGTFPLTVATGSAYSITVLSQPIGGTCIVGSGSGIANTNETVTVSCNASTPTDTISVATTGLTGTLVVQDDKADNLTFTTNNTQQFATSYASGSTYTVSVKTQPSGQTCTLSANATGTITANTTVTATCTTNTFTISVATTGLTGTLVVQDDKADNLTFTTNSTQQFATSYASGSTYTVSVKTQPSGQTCTLGSNATGTITAITTVTATCVTDTPKDTISVTPVGLIGTLVVQDDKLETLSFTSNTNQPFPTQYTSGSTYTVSIKTQPSTQTCTLGSNATGTITANTTVTATCVSNFTISVAVTGLTGTLVMQDDKADNLTFSTSNTQTFASTYASGSTYTVSVKTQPAGQTCTLGSNATGTITANTTVTATCTSNTFTLSVAVTGLTGTLVVQDDKTDSLSFTTNITKTFAASYASGSTYTVSVQTQPSGQTCTLSANASGTITANTTVTATCVPSGGGNQLSVSVTGLTGSVEFTDDLGDVLTFTGNGTKSFATSYTNGATYTVYVSSQPATKSCIPTYSTGTISSAVTIDAACATGSTRALGKVTGVQPVTCSGGIKNGVCQQMNVSCPGVPDVLAFVKTNTPSGSSLGTATYGTGTDGNGLYESIFTFGSTAVGNVLAAGFTTVQISWGTPFNTTQPNGWVEGPGGVLASACRYATVTQWIYDNIHNSSTTLPYCATANSGGSGALAYALSQYPTGNILSMAEVTSGPPTGRLDWGCGCTQGKVAVQCGSAPTLGTCFGVADAPVWDPAYDPNASTGVCSAAVNGTLPPGGLNFFLGDSVEAPGAAYSLPKTHVNLVFGSADNSSAIPIGQDWFDNITSTKSQACVAGGVHSLADTSAGALQIANDIINLCQIQ